MGGLSLNVQQAFGPVFYKRMGVLGGSPSAANHAGVKPGKREAPANKYKESKERKMAVGVVKWWDEKRGFGFISIDGEDDVFVHRSVIEGSEKYLIEGESVELETEPSPKGWRATVVWRKQRAVVA